MDCFKRCVLFLALWVSATGCVREPVYPVPTVVFEVDWSGISATGRTDGQTDSVYVYLYPKFDYSAQPILIKSFYDDLTYSLMPGDYGVIMHNAPMLNMQCAYTDSYDNFTFYMPFDDDKRILTSGALHMLPANDNMHSITISAFDENKFVFKPITATKNIRFVIKTSRFGDIVSAYGVLSGIVSSISAKSWKLSPVDISSIKLPDFTVEDSTLSGGQVDVIGFNPKPNPVGNERVILTLYVSNREVDFPLEQQIDLTDYIKNIEGDEIEITITMPFEPSSNAYVELKEWLAGSELEIGVS